jgi:hypothetical protein
MPVEQQQEPASGRIRQRGEVIVNGRGGLAHAVLYIRQSGWKD